MWAPGAVPWFPEWVQRNRPPTDTQARAAEALLRVMGPVGRAAALARPDAWVHPCTQHLVFKDPKSAAYVPLCPGDSVHFSHVQRIFFLYHDMVYVGGGCVVSLIREDNRCITKGVAVLERLDAVRRTGPQLYFNMHPRVLPRRTLVVRALLSLGYFPYSIQRFNCQHFFHLVSGDGMGCPGLVDAWGVVAGGAAALLVIVALLLVARLGAAPGPVAMPPPPPPPRIAGRGIPLPLPRRASRLK
jgi:hypothetical protein